MVGIDVGGTNTDAVLLQFEEESTFSNATTSSTVLSSDSDRLRWLEDERVAFGLSEGAYHCLLHWRYPQCAYRSTPLSFGEESEDRRCE